jgi:hypothetical protein
MNHEIAAQQTDTTSKLVSELIGSLESGRLHHFYHRLDRLDLLIVDEMVYGRFSVSLNSERSTFRILRDQSRIRVGVPQCSIRL